MFLLPKLTDGEAIFSINIPLVRFDLMYVCFDCTSTYDGCSITSSYWKSILNETSKQYNKLLLNSKKLYVSKYN